MKFKKIRILLLLAFLAACAKDVGPSTKKRNIKLDLPPEGSIVTNSTIGGWGRFGNQVYQYIFLKVYAKRRGMTVQTRDWIGNQLFGLDDPRVTNYFPVLAEPEPGHKGNPEEYKELCESYAGESSKVFFDRDFRGYFQIHTSNHAADKEYIRTLFKPTAEIRDQLQPAIDSIKSQHTLVAIHLRRGDFGFWAFVISPTQWYLQWLKANWSRFKSPILYIASDEPAKVLPDFAAYRPITSSDLKHTFKLEGAEFYPDFYVLSHSDVLLISNSSFSTAAALLNETGKEFYRPKFEKETMTSFDPWNTDAWENWHRVKK